MYNVYNIHKPTRIMGDYFTYVKLIVSAIHVVTSRKLRVCK